MQNKSSNQESREVWFTGPHQVEVRGAKARAPSLTEVIVSTEYSAVSAGSELLL